MTSKATGTGLAVVLGCVMSVGAQQRPNAPPGVQNAANNPTDQIKATGCLSKDTSGKFVLSGASIEVAPWSAPNAPAAKSATAPGALPSKTAFVLQNGVNLDQHVSHKIEVTGKVAPASANVAPDSPDIVVPPPQAEPAGRGAAGAGRAGGTTRTYLPALTVQSVKMIATSCS
jgi:hypothetical protein